MVRIFWALLALIFAAVMSAGTYAEQRAIVKNASVTELRLGTLRRDTLEPTQASSQDAAYLAPLLEALESRSALRFKVVGYPTPSALLQALRVGEVQVLAPFSPTAERRQFLDFSAPFGNSSVVILAGPRYDGSSGLGIEQLPGKRVSVMTQGYPHSYLKERLPALDMATYADDRDVLAAVLMGRVDFAVIDYSRAIAATRELGISDLRIVGTITIEDDVAFAVPRGNTRTLGLLNNALHSLSSTELAQIHKAALVPGLPAWYDYPQVYLVAIAAILIALAAIGSGWLARRKVKSIHALLGGNPELLSSLNACTFIFEKQKQRIRLGRNRHTVFLLPTNSGHLLQLDDFCRVFERNSADRFKQALLQDATRAAFGIELELASTGREQRWVKVCCTGRFSKTVAGTARQVDLPQLRQYDPITGLPSCEALLTHLDAQLTLRPEQTVMLAHVGIDGFKPINASHGRECGDRLLRQVAARLRAAIQSQGMVFRLEGDEFIVVVTGASAVLSEETTATWLSGAFAPPFALPQGGDVFLTASIGTSCYDRIAKNSAELLSMAATALRSAKLGGKNTWRAYSMADAVLIRQWEQSHYDVRKAFDQKELELHYQPKIEVATGAICGVEALLRWKSEHGYRAPGPLIEAAEQSGFIVTLGSWIVATAAQQANAWFEEGLSLPIAVNISAKQLSTPGFLEMVHTLVWQNPRLPKQLEFELTETAFEDDFPRVEKVITELAAMGFEIHLDDFGTGYSSLSRMYQFPVHTLKIDRMFTAQLQDNDRVRGMVEGLLLMCRSIGVKVVAEGVEEPEQLDFLRRMGCEQAQGYLFSKAIPARDFVSFLAAHRNSLLQAA